MMANNFNRTEYYNFGTYKNDKYVLYSHSKNEIMRFLRENTYYTEDKFKSMSDKQLYFAYANIKASIRLYIEEIKKALKEQPEILNFDPPVITEEQIANLHRLTYNELSSLRQTLCLDKRRKKQLVLVKDTKPKTIKNPDVSEYHQYSLEEIFGSQTFPSIEKTKYITTEEGYEIFGEQFPDMTSEELSKKGYKLTVTEEQNREAINLHEELKYRIIVYMSLHNFQSYDGEQYEEAELSKMSLTELRNIYTGFSLYYQGIPSYEKIEQGLKLKIKEGK